MFVAIINLTAIGLKARVMKMSCLISLSKKITFRIGVKTSSCVLLTEQTI